MFKNFREWIVGKRNGATSGAEVVEKAMREAIEGPAIEDTQPVTAPSIPSIDADGITQAPHEERATTPEPPVPIQIIATFEAEGSAEFSFHRDHRVSPMMMCPLIDYMISIRDLEYQTIVLNQKRQAADEEKSRIKIARNLPPIFRGKRR